METPVNRQFLHAPRRPNGQLRPGARLNPHGRPVGSGGGIAATMRMLSEIANSAEFRAAMQAEARRDPIRYARAVVLPLTPAKYKKALRESIRAYEKAS